MVAPERDIELCISLLTGKSNKKANAIATKTGINKLLNKVINNAIQIKSTTRVTAWGSENLRVYQSLNNLNIITYFLFCLA